MRYPRLAGWNTARDASLAVSARTWGGAASRPIRGRTAVQKSQSIEHDEERGARVRSDCAP